MRTHLTAHYRGRIVRVPVDTVTHFVSGEKYTAAHHAEGETLLSDSLIKLAAEFPEFVQSHRSCLVRRSLVQEFRKLDSKMGQVILRGVSEPQPVSLSHRDAIKSVFEEECEE